MFFNDCQMFPAVYRSGSLDSPDYSKLLEDLSTLFNV